MLSSVKKHWFLVGVVVVIALAKLAPWIGSKGGPLLPEVTVKYVAVCAIFFFNGLQLKTDVIVKAMSEVKVHLFVQLYTFVFIPGVLHVTVRFLVAMAMLDEILSEGLTVVSCMPPPVSSAVILTSAVLLSKEEGQGRAPDSSPSTDPAHSSQGAIAASVFNSVFGSFMGIIISPLLMLALVGVSSTLPFGSIIIKLASTVVAPLFVGQVVRHFIKSKLESAGIPFSQISSGILLLIIYTTFCDTFSHSDIALDPLSLLTVVVIIIFIQVIMLALVNVIADRFLQFPRPMVVAMMFCSTHKSLTLGIPMMKIVFAGEPHLTLLSVPLLVYHPTQIILGAFSVPLLQRWVCPPAEPAAATEGV